MGIISPHAANAPANTRLGYWAVLSLIDAASYIYGKGVYFCGGFVVILIFASLVYYRRKRNKDGKGSSRTGQLPLHRGGRAKGMLGLGKEEGGRKTRRSQSIAVLSESTSLLMESCDDLFESSKPRRHSSRSRRVFTTPMNSVLATLPEVDSDTEHGDDPISRYRATDAITGYSAALAGFKAA
ncbi:hypothetical protein GGH94_002115 [Coemansia aciculifera]|uniref:Uncharacterized protein n=1 Tax=Coemansia aciculifera TaxID=417176 RepID=A0A9W8IKF0_9FUNG|nr:hypothetical protein GGH94_002115 [Coemansia aciculifera]